VTGLLGTGRINFSNSSCSSKQKWSGLVNNKVSLKIKIIASLAESQGGGVCFKKVRRGETFNAKRNMKALKP